MLRIGFTTEFYTLWNVTTREEYVNEYYSYTKVLYTYIQNLSTDLNKAIAKAEEMGCKDLSVDTDLFGRNKSFETKKDNIKPKQCTEEVILWRMICSNSSEYTKEVKEGAKQQLIDLGYAQIVNNALVSTKHAEAYAQWFEDKATNVLETSFVVEKNADQEGIFYVNGNKYCFGVKSGYYNGFTYYLPIDKSGKSKRVKGKTIEIKEFEVLEADNDSVPFKTWFCPKLDNLACYNEDDCTPKFHKGGFTIKVTDFKVI